MTEAVSMATDRETDDYRPLSTLAVCSGVSGLLSGLAWITPTMLIMAIFGTLIGGMAVVALRRRTSEVAGMRIAVGGLAAALVCLLGGTAWHRHQYTIEVPAGFERVDLSDIFDAEIEDATPALLQLQGRRIAVKAYMDPFYSPDSTTGFTISRMESTGFGATARPGERLVVELAEGLNCDYSQAPVVISGLFDIESGIAGDGSRFRLILMDATLRPATSAIGLPMRNPRSC